MTAPQSNAEKERAAQLVAQLPPAEQVDLLAQALLREYMHRRGFTNTLRAFDAQNPRDERTISSRAVMRQLLNIPVEGRPSRLVPQPAAPGSKKTVAPTYMEELCSYRLTKRDYALRTQQMQQLERRAEAASTSEARLTSEEADTLAHWRQDRQAWQDPSDTEMMTWREDTTQHRLQREAAERLVMEGPALVEDEAARAERKQRRKDEKRQLKAARRQEKKAKKAKKIDHADGDVASDDGETAAATAAAAHAGHRWAPPGVGEPLAAASTRTSVSPRTSLDRAELGWTPASAQDKEDWTLSGMALNPILSAARSDMEALDDSEGLAARRVAGVGSSTGASSSSSPSPSLGHAPFTARPLGALSGGGGSGGGSGLAGTGTAFHAAPLAAAPRAEIMEVWKPQSSAMSSSTGAGYYAAPARGSGGDDAMEGGQHRGSGAFTYNPSAMPTVSAMAKPGAPIATPTTSSILSHRHSGSSSASGGTGSSGGLGSAAGGGGGGGGDSGGLASAVRGDGEHLAHSASSAATGGPMRQGFGFRKDSGGAADAAAGRKGRRVKLLVD